MANNMAGFFPPGLDRNFRDSGPLTSAERATRSVFVGNIPYEATEEQLKDIFAQVGPVLSFRLVYDRETGKPKGYGFCEYQDTETAQSAMRNLNNHDFNGRPLRVGVAAGEQNKDENKSMQQALGGPPIESPFGDPIETEKAPEAISKAVASLPPEQMFELMKQMKMCIQNNPNEARNMLLQNPQLAYALLQAQIVMKIVDPQVALAMLHRQTEQIPPLVPSENEQTPQDTDIRSQVGSGPGTVSSMMSNLGGPPGAAAPASSAGAAVGLAGLGLPRLPGLQVSTGPALTSMGGMPAAGGGPVPSSMGGPVPGSMGGHNPSSMAMGGQVPSSMGGPPIRMHEASSGGPAQTIMSTQTNMGPRPAPDFGHAGRGRGGLLGDRPTGPGGPGGPRGGGPQSMDTDFRDNRDNRGPGQGMQMNMRGGPGPGPRGQGPPGPGRGPPQEFGPGQGRVGPGPDAGHMDSRGSGPRMETTRDPRKTDPRRAPSQGGMGGQQGGMGGQQGGMGGQQGGMGGQQGGMGGQQGGMGGQQGPGPGPGGPMPGGAGAGAGQDQEKAALIMQVLQLSDEQIALLPPDQRQSILILKDQIARSSGGL